MNRQRTTLRFIHNEQLIMKRIDRLHYDVHSISNGSLVYQFVYPRGWMNSNGTDCDSDTENLLDRVLSKLEDIANPKGDD